MAVTIGRSSGAKSKTFQPAGVQAPTIFRAGRAYIRLPDQFGLGAYGRQADLSEEEFLKGNLPERGVWRK